MPSTAAIRVMLVYGTRPEAIKMAPLVKAFAQDPRFDPRIVVTGQHREMLDQVHSFFDIKPDLDLNIHKPGQTLTQVTTRTLQGTDEAIRGFAPDAIAVQGDTSSAFAAALAAFYHQKPVLHVEAGLRTGDIASPFPEEANRRLIGQLTALHLCPTAESKDNLLRENTPPESIRVTGNTVIDALLAAVERPVPSGDERLDAAVAETSRRMVLVTAHRRESWGAPMARIGRAVARLADAFPDVACPTRMTASSWGGPPTSTIVRSRSSRGCRRAWRLSTRTSGSSPFSARSSASRRRLGPIRTRARRCPTPPAREKTRFSSPSC